MKTFDATLDNLYMMLAHIRASALEAGFSEESTSKIELALEEALVNIVCYAYPENKGIIELQCKSDKKGMTILIRDSGVPFNPLKYEAKSPSPSQGIGGYGIHFIKQIMDDIQYTRDNNSNVLLMTKYNKSRV